MQKKELLEEKLKVDQGNWDTRKELAHLLYNQGYTKEASELVWRAPEIPSIDLEIAFAAIVVGKARPGRAIRLLNGVLEMNEGKAVQNLGLANALLHHGMVMQAARFYGAATSADPDLVSADLEHFLLWIDDSRKLWGDFGDELEKLEELPWMTRDAEEAARLKKSMKGHTTPISIPGLHKLAAEEANHARYVQADTLKARTTPPPAVTIPMDRVNPKDILIDNERGAGPPKVAAASSEAVSQSVGTPLPQVSLAEPLSAPVPVDSPNGGQTVRAVALQDGGGGLQPVPVPTPSQPLIPEPVASQPLKPRLVVGAEAVATATASQPLTPSATASQPLTPSPTATQPLVPSPTATQPLVVSNGEAKISRQKSTQGNLGADGKIRINRG